MRIGLLVLFFLTAFCLGGSSGVYADPQDQKGVLIHDIRIDGFVLGDKEQFVKLFKPYRNKYLTTDDMDKVLEMIQVIYESDGYLELVTISYKVDKHRLIFTVLMSK